MKLDIIGRNVKVTEGMKAKLTDKISKLDKYLNDKDVTARVVVRTVKNDQIVEVTIPVLNKSIRAEKRSNDLYAAIDMVEEALSKQLRRNKNKNIDKKRQPMEMMEEEMEEDTILVVREKHVPLVIDSVQGAIEEMENLGHDFHVFVDEATKATSIVYRRKDNDYGIIIADM